MNKHHRNAFALSIIDRVRRFRPQIALPVIRSQKTVRMVHYVVAPLGVTFLSGILSYSDALRAVLDQKRQPFPAPWVLLGIVAKEGQYDNRFTV